MLGYIIEGIYFPEKVLPPEYGSEDTWEGQIPLELRWVNKSPAVEGYSSKNDGRCKSWWHQCFLDAREAEDLGDWLYFDSTNSRIILDKHIDEVLDNIDMVQVIVSEANHRFTEKVKADIAKHETRDEAVAAYRAKAKEVDAILRSK